MVMMNKKIPAVQGLLASKTSICCIGVVLLALLAFSFQIRSIRHSGNDGNGGSSSVPAAALTLVMGLPRSGSLAIHEFFACNQIQSSHYCCGSGSSSGGGGTTEDSTFPCGQDSTTCGSCVFHNLNQSLPAFEGCGPPGTKVYSQFDVETGDPFSWFLPQHFAMPLLYKGYTKQNGNDDMVWILNRRSNSGQWAVSVLHWFSVSNRLFHAFGLQYWSDLDESSIPVALKLSVTQDQLEEHLEESVQRATSDSEHERRIALLARIYDDHWQKVADFAKRHSIRLVQVNVDDAASAARVLVAAFGGKESCWKFDPKMMDEDWKDFSLKV